MTLEGSASMSANGLVGSPQARPMTVAAMRAAVVAIRAGVFDRVDGAEVIAGDAALNAAVICEACRRDAPRVPWADVDGIAAAVVVAAGHAGAGATTVALAVAEALADSCRVQLVEYADPARSGLTSASTIELGIDGAWRRGRRGRLDVLRLAQPPADERPPPKGDGSEQLLVVDAGCALTTARPEGRTALSSIDLLVVATRVTVPAIRQTEHVLAAVGGDAWVAAVGPSRWPRAVEASVGSHLGRLRSRGRVVQVPLDARLAVTGLTGDRLPRSVAAAGRSLAGLLVPTGPPRHRRRAAAS
ncbi:hypothetical protein SAMN05660657_03314 [Geodermatophilus amargosae]|uniref:MinD-like ATPase involved in chromosome partitioning or flagellar assembly n=1 Tax=Geodermatophilus amargosae TaxID=1296565 RepID=A0A1I7B5Y6_9ACTN|nr:hypothetical protein [Geodermatophilus amargosae]SFT82552.1 hypothetical protein SAMN05660657_03314 [Geodermatophilus amargosae]